MRWFHGIRGPAERCVTRHQRGSDIWDVSSFEEAADCKPGVFFVVAFDFRGCQVLSYRNGPRGTNRRVLCRNIELYNALEPEQWQIQSAYVLLRRQMENVCRVQDG